MGRDEKQEPPEQDLLFEVNAHVHEAARRFAGWRVLSCAVLAPSLLIVIVYANT